MSEPDQNSPVSDHASEEENASILNRIKALERFCDAEDDMGYKQRQLRLNKWLIILTAVIAIASLVGNYIGITSSNAAKKSADAAILQAEINKMALESSIEIARTEQRAWVLCNGFTFEKDLRAGEFNPIFLRIKNAGKTPAYHLRIKYTSRMKEDGKPEIVMTELREEDLSLGPGRELQLTFGTIPEKWNQADIDAIESQKKVLTLFVEISYQDIFKNLRRTGICSFYNPRLKPHLTLCSDGNYVE